MPRYRLGRPRPDLVSCLKARRHPGSMFQSTASAQGVAAVRSAWKVAPSRTRRCPTRCTDPVWTKQRGQGGRPTATHHYGYRHYTPQAAHGRCRARNVVIVDNDRGDSPSSYRARALTGLVLRRCPEIPPEHMQGGSRCPGPAVEPSQSARGGMTRGARPVAWAHA